MRDKPSLDELAHYGVKGMKWGVRKADGGRRRATTEEIRNARIKTDMRLRAAKTLTKQIKDKSNTEKGRKQALKSLGKVASDYINSDDTRIAHMRTKGEEFMNVINSGGLGVLDNRANRRLTTEEVWNEQRKKLVTIK